MATYVDGFVIPLPKKNLPAYRRMAKLGCKVWTDHGAIAYLEAAGDDLNIPMGLGFKKGMKLKPSDTVVFAFIVYRSRKDRDRINKLAMTDPRLAGMMNQKMPFDVKRFMMGGFKTIVEAR